ncbi:hypothetical protein [Mesorhizobium sp.]|uniref:hypothetical protein n=1 Tax=Mesorhizobium sp. TaxID=1871066 RepID=UPI0025809B9A|nr:hypothetical protein [Mesorhizobium sp.]
MDLLTIQAWLGHAQVATTHRYAAADVEMMRNGTRRRASPAITACVSDQMTPFCNCRTASKYYVAEESGLGRPRLAPGT